MLIHRLWDILMASKVIMSPTHKGNEGFIGNTEVTS